MARCGCAGTTCSCAIEGGPGIEVTGAGTTTNPYVVSAEGVGGGGALTVLDTQTLDLALSGDGSSATPYLLSGTVTITLDEVLDVSASAAPDGYVLAWDADTQLWTAVPPTTAPVGAIAVGAGLLGDGSAGDPLRVDATAPAVPPGTVVQFAGSSAPAGWLLCTGQAVSRATYASLFAVISTLYGAGNGSTTFNLPDLTGRVPVGASSDYALGSRPGSATHVHTVLAHVHTVVAHTHTVAAHSHALNSSGYARINVPTGAAPGVHMHRVAAASWPVNARSTAPYGSEPVAGVNDTLGAGLGGSTASAAAVTTSSAGGGETGSAGGGDTSSVANLPNALSLNYLIRY